MNRILVCDQCGTPARERCQHVHDAEYRVQPEDDYLEDVRGIQTVYRIAFLLAAVAALAFLAVSCQQERERHAAYRALPSADERLLSADYLASEDVRLTRMVEREWRKVAE